MVPGRIPNPLPSTAPSLTFSWESSSRSLHLRLSRGSKKRTSQSLKG